ncbi:MAG: pantoate--beta-alanine ligase [Candidatus Mcinerneyibacterium aminivorans]|uniref:Pantothenate synthetase n=1 Tax=Candidatus Mcinerneyibacterium aminivorans TaxID=2703815 RepID=A0A5D0MHR7_9BACT|nr:MAG: pantoate--beta-alanine ligase [Candidatus Mcinerneyibacterium aminivorans]
MRITKYISKIREIVNNEKMRGNSIGFVPTMGFLHEGHLSLIRESVKNEDFTIVSIYVNPTQFAPDEDFEEYPRDIERDIKMCEKEGVDLIFSPEDETMYPEGFQTHVIPGELSNVLCGESRPTFFRGVCTIVTKLLNIVRPHRAYFGQKDYQQYKIISRMVRDLNMQTEIKSCPIIRESDGLAISSRNMYLNSKERKEAASLYESLQAAEKMLKNGINESSKIKAEMKKIIEAKDTTEIDYISIVNEKNLKSISDISKADKILIALAVYVGRARLIDNMVWVVD